MKFNEDQFSRWSGSPSATEAQRIENTEVAVRKAISASDELKGRNIRIFAQGSYRNRVNVRTDSDVDIAVLCTDTFFWDGPDGATLQSLGYNDATYMYTDFRREVGNALRNYFGAASVTQGNKAFDVSANTYRVEADVVPFFEYRRFETDASYITGVEMRPQSGGRVINWPEQHYQNGVTKNTQSSRSFKGCVRIIKTLRYMMMAEGIKSADSAPSFFLELT